MKIYYHKPSGSNSIYNILSFIIHKEIDAEIKEIVSAREIEDSSENYYLFSFFSINEYKTFNETIASFRRGNIKNVKIIVGGSALLFLDNPSDLFEFYPEISYIVMGKGENVINHLLTENVSQRQIFHDKDFGQVESYLIRDSFINDIGPVIKITFDDQYCPWRKCSFCQYVLDLSSSYKNSVEDVYNEISYYYERGFKEYLFYDNWTPLNKVTELFDLLLENNINDIRFSILSIHINNNAYKSLAPYIEKFKPGLFTMSIFGVEFLDDEILSTYNKGINVNKISEVVDFCSDTNLPFGACILYGLPLVENRHIENHINNFNQLDLHNRMKGGTCFSFFILNKHLDVYKDPDFFKIKIKNNYTLTDFYNDLPELKLINVDFDQWDDDKNKWLNRDEVIEKYLQFDDLFYVKSDFQNIFERQVLTSE